jgi:hypothetical protein
VYSASSDLPPPFSAYSSSTEPSSSSQVITASSTVYAEPSSSSSYTAPVYSSAAVTNSETVSYTAPSSVQESAPSSAAAAFSTGVVGTSASDNHYDTASVTASAYSSPVSSATFLDGTRSVTASTFGGITASVTSAKDTAIAGAQFTSASSSGIDTDIATLQTFSGTPTTTGAQVQTFTGVSSSTDTDSTGSVTTSSISDDAYTPSQTWLIVAQTSSSSTSTAGPTSMTGTATTATATLPSTAAIPSSVPTLIVPANSVVNQPNAGSGGDNDPLKSDTLISLLLSADEYPWLFVYNSSDATSQLFNTFPTLIANALNISTSSVKTYGLMVYQPASWDGNQAELLTQWLAYIPTAQFDTLNTYLKTQSSPLFNQAGINGQLAAQINTAYPLAATSGVATTGTGGGTSGSKGNKTRNIIIGVCVAIGGLLWIILVWWIYKRVKRSNDKTVHRRLSEHMSMFDGNGRASGYGGYGAAMDRRHSGAPSIAASDVDDRPSSFYASPLDNDRSMRQIQNEPVTSGQGATRDYLGEPTTYGPSVFGNSWFAQPNPPLPPKHLPHLGRRNENPFDDMMSRSYMSPSDSRGSMGARRSAMGQGVRVGNVNGGSGVAVQKGMISQPTLQANSLEFRE